MHVLNTHYHRFDSDQMSVVFRVADSDSVTGLVLEIPEGVTLSTGEGHYALNIPKLKNLKFLKIICDGQIDGAGGFGRGGGIVNWNAVPAEIVGKGRIRGGGAATGALRYAIYGSKLVTPNSPRIFHF